MTCMRNYTYVIEIWQCTVLNYTLNFIKLTFSFSDTY